MYSDISDQHLVTMRNKFDILQEISERHTSDNGCENFFTAHIEAAAECNSINSIDQC